ncbi:MAG TPA: amino acid ABC transporter permease [Acidimicrobiales bacterium]|nr:amino acid ABC transporter permease [Acidimicrobiales bacterium]
MTLTTAPETPTTGAPRLARSPGTWLRRNLFRSRADSATTVVVGALAVYLLFRLVQFVFVTGRWDVIRVNLKLLMVGRFPDVHLPRVAISLVIAAAVIGLVAGVVNRRQLAAGTSTHATMSVVARLTDLVERFWPVLLGAGLVLGLTSTPGPSLTVAGAIAAGFVGRIVGGALPKQAHPVVVVAALVTPFLLTWYLADAIGWDGWGGLMLNVFMAVVSLILCFPLGVLAALGRRSNLPIVRAISTGFIELFRGAPLFVLLLMANVALGFFLPEGTSPSTVVRAIVVFTLFTAAYVAEVVRGGLQSLPSGQTEAGRALGLSPVRITFLIVLPQALRNVIPALVGQFISLFKDTTLAGAAMGLFELFRVTEAITQQGAFAGQGLVAETFMFAGLLFWIGSYTMSRESQRIESKLGVGTR